MDAWGPRAWKLGFKDASRRELLRNSLDKARTEMDIGHKRLARSARATDLAQALDLPQAIALGAPPITPAVLHDWDHGGACYWFWTSEARDENSDYNEAELAAAATVCAAEFEVSRSFAKL